MFILWRRTRNGYTVVDTSDFSEEEYDRPTLRKIVRSSGVKVQGITIDDKNVIHFKAQSKAYNNTSIDAARARGALSGAYNQNYREYTVPPCSRVERYDIPFLGADVTYVITDATLQNADIVALPMGARKVRLSIKNLVQLRGFILPPTTEKLEEDTTIITRVSYYYDFPWYFNHCYLNCIPPVSDLRYLHDFENCENASLRGSWTKGLMRLRGSYRITDTDCHLDYLAIVPDILIISNAVRVVSSYHLGLCFKGIEYGRDRTKYKQASLNAAEWVFNHQSTYIEELSKKMASHIVPRIIQFEDVRQIEELNLGPSAAGMVFVIPRGNKRYFTTELLTPSIASRNIVIEF